MLCRVSLGYFGLFEVVPDMWL